MMTVYDRAKSAADYIRSKVQTIPENAIVLGSGLGTFGDSIVQEVVIPYGEVPNFPRVTVQGHKGNFVFGKVDGKPILALQGRFHLYEGYSTEDVTLYVRILALLGVKNLILTNAAGAINTSFAPGDLMLITDHISTLCLSPLFGPNDERFGPRFPSMSYAYDRELQKLAEETANGCGILLQKGVFFYTKGPMYETPAEIRAYRIMGADACAMSTVPEVIVAVHCGMRVMGISCITNMAAGVLDKPLDHSEVMETGKKVEEKFKTLISAIFAKL